MIGMDTGSSRVAASGRLLDDIMMPSPQERDNRTFIKPLHSSAALSNKAKEIVA